MSDDPKGRISRPRQIYTGATERPWVPLSGRKTEEKKAPETREPVLA
jgi:hypothetical protein